MKNRNHPLLGLFLIIVIHGSAARAQPGFVKVVLEANDRQAGGPPAEILARLEAKTVRSYPAFTVVRVPEARRDDLDAVASAYGFHAVVHDDWNSVHMPGFVVDTQAPSLPAAAVLRGYPGGEGLFVIQFAAPLDAEWTGQVEKAGLRYVAYLPYNAVLVYGRQSDVARLAARPQVQWSSLYHPAFRARPADLDTSDQPGRYVVQLVDVPESQAVIAELLEASASAGQAVSYGPYTNVTVEVGPDLLRRLIGDPHVVGIERAAAPMLSGEREAIGATSSTVSTTEPYQDGVRPYKPAGDYRTWLNNRSPYLTGLLFDQIIAVADTGLAGGTTYPIHSDLSMPYWKNYCGGGDNFVLDKVGHGTMVAGFAAGNPSATAGDPIGSQVFQHGMGLAPGASLFVQRITDVATTYCSDINTWAQEAIDKRAAVGAHSVVQTHSHNDYATITGTCTQPANGAYTTESQSYDFAVRDKALPITVSAGNVCQFSGQPAADCALQHLCPSMVLPPATAKNVLSVGASESYRTGMAPPCDHNTVTSRQSEDYWASTFKRIAFVSRQGTADGRIKPDIVAPASMVSSTIRKDIGTFKPFCKRPDPLLPVDQGLNGLYSIDTGTSFAAPQAAGAMAVINTYHEWAFQPALSPAALKATLVGSSVSLKGGINDLFGSPVAARPNSAQGFGRLNLEMAMTATPVQGVLDESSWESFTGAGQTRTRTFNVNARGKPTVIVLAWTDEPGLAQASPTLVRDLDLEVSLNDACTIYVGNQLNSATEYSLPGSSCGSKQPADTKNNVEMVVIPPGGATSFTLRVTAATWAGSIPRAFAVYYYNAY